MNLLDVGIVILFVSTAMGGYKLGFTARTASWVGLLFGLYLVIRLIPWAVTLVENTSPANRFLYICALLLAGGAVGQTIGLGLGAKFRKRLQRTRLRTADSVAGGISGIIGAGLLLWVLLPAMGAAPGWPSQLARNSAMARYITDVAPRPPDTLKTLKRLVGDHNYPQVFGDLQPAPDAGPAPATSGLPADVEQRVLRSTVKIEAIGCGGIQEGSGFAAGPDLIATNAHVIAGSDEIRVIKVNGQRLEATTLMFDADRDLALLDVDGLRAESLNVESVEEKAVVGVFGHPGGQDTVRVAPARVAGIIRATGRDLYDSRSTEREIFVLASDLHQGDSGAAVVNRSGNVTGVAFAIAPDKPGTGYALTSKELLGALNERRVNATSTGVCIAG